MPGSDRRDHPSFETDGMVTRRQILNGISREREANNLADLIDKKKLLKAVLDEYADGNFYVMHLIRDFPAEEAVVPVRCRNCRYSQWSTGGRILCRHWNGMETRTDGYCWKGKTWD